MAFLSKLRFYVVSVVAFYLVYLFSYKCHQKTLLEHLTHPGSGKYLNHPFAAQHDQLCDVLNSGSNYVAPYVDNVVSFLDKHVHSHPTFKKYQVAAHVENSKSFYSKNVAPYVHKLWQYVEVVEYHLATKISQLTGHAQHHYKKTVAPMAGDLHSSLTELVKNTVVPKAGELKDQIADAVADSYNNLPNADEVKKSIVDNIPSADDVKKSAEEAQEAVAAHYKAAKQSVESLKDDVKAKIE